MYFLLSLTPHPLPLPSPAQLAIVTWSGLICHASMLELSILDVRTTNVHRSELEKNK